ncbi:MAG: sensor histidine kinase, partial [Dehalococcoidia bacterium]
VKAQEEERKRLARELHDSTIQSLLSIYNRLQSVAEHPQRLDDVCGLLEHTISDVRDFTWGLRPPLLDDMGLAPTLRWLVDKMSKNSDLLLEIYIVGEERRLSTNIELSLYRIAQEAISNIQRHAKASTAKVTLTFGKDKVSLSIIDDGCGFNVPARLTHFAGKGKLGIVGMNERSMDIGATIKFESEPGKGTAVNVEVPIPRNELPALYF